MSPVSFWTVALTVFCVVIFVVGFTLSYNQLEKAIQTERTDYVEEISAQIISNQRFMEHEYSDLTKGYATLLNNNAINSLADVRSYVVGKSSQEILLGGEDGNFINLDGDAVVLTNRLLLRMLPEDDEIVTMFASMDYSNDCWLFAAHINPVNLDGQEYNAIILAVSANEFRDNLSILLFDGRGASYIVNNDGSIKIKPTDTEQLFDGYNLFFSMISLGANEAEVLKLEADMRSSDTGSFLLKIGTEDWLISHSAVDRDTSIVVTVPLSVTAVRTYDGLNNTIIFAAMTVFLFSFFILFVIVYFINRDRKRTREAMAVKAKSEFFSKMSHDIRTPLNAVIGLELLAKDSSDNPQVKDYLEKSSSAARYLLGILNDVLDMSRIEGGKLTIARLPFSMSNVLDEIKAIVTPMAADNGLSLSFECDEFITAYLGDQIRIKQILMNLLSNATKFTPEGGSVTLRATREPGEDGGDVVTFVVSDTGIGISAEYLTRVFKPFEQERSSVTEKKTGSGLGLSIVHNLTELMNGEITVESRLGVGTEFTVVIPFECSNEVVRTEKLTESRELGKYEGRRVLIAEDNVLNQQIASAILFEKFGLASDIAVNGQEAVEMFAASAAGYYDLILMDVNMPVMDGLDSTRAIRALKRADAAVIPIVALSANAFENDIELSISAGMNAHLSKPLEIPALAQVLKDILSQEDSL